MKKNAYGAPNPHESTHLPNAQYTIKKPLIVMPLIQQKIHNF